MENMIFDEFMQKWTHPAETATSMDVNFVWNGSANGSDEVSIVELYGPKRDPLYVVVPITVLYTIIFVTGFVGNICTCIVIAKNRNMHTATNYYLFSLAISDFLLLVTGMPQEIFFIWSKYPYVFGELFCILRGLCAETSTNATVLTITAFTVERYVAICHPFLSHTMSKLSRAWKFIVGVWIVSIAFAIPQALQFGVVNGPGDIEQCTVKHIVIQHSFEVSTFLFFIAPMTLITILYILIGVKLRSSTIARHSSNNRQHKDTVTRYNKSVRRVVSNTPGSRRVLKMLVAVVLAFFICWAPFHAQRLVYIYSTNIDHTPPNPTMLIIFTVMTYVSGILYYLSTCINPFLYNIMSHKFREAFKETLGRWYRIWTKQRIFSKTKTRTKHNCERQHYHYQHQQQPESSDFTGNDRDESLLSSSAAKKHSLASTISVTLRDDHCPVYDPNHLFPYNYEPFGTTCNDKFAENIQCCIGVDGNTKQMAAKVNSIDTLMNDTINLLKPVKYRPIVTEPPSKPDVCIADLKRFETKRPAINDVNGNKLIVIDLDGATCCKVEIDGSLTCDRTLIQRELIMHEDYLSGTDGDTELHCYMCELKKRQAVVCSDLEAKQRQFELSSDNNAK